MKHIVLVLFSLGGIFYSPNAFSQQRITDTAGTYQEVILPDDSIYGQVKKVVGNKIASDLFALFSNKDSLTRQEYVFEGMIQKKLSHIRITYFPQEFVNISIGRSDSYELMSFYPTWNSAMPFLTYKRNCSQILSDIIELYRQVLYTDNYTTNTP